MGEKEVITCRQSDRTLTYVCKEHGEMGSPLASTHKIVVSRESRTNLQCLLLLVVCFLTGLITMRDAAEFSQSLPLLGALAIIYSARRRRVVEEVIVVLPTFGVQLETVFHSKKVHRHFVPLHKIVAPVINEAVSPVTCYFYMALLLRGEDDMVLTFPSLRPPLKMLVPIWRSLCTTLGTEAPRNPI